MSDLPALSDEKRQRDLSLAKRQMALDVAAICGAITALVGAGMALGWGWPAMAIGAIVYFHCKQPRG